MCSINYNKYINYNHSNAQYSANYQANDLYWPTRAYVQFNVFFLCENNGSDINTFIKKLTNSSAIKLVHLNINNYFIFIFLIINLLLFSKCTFIIIFFNKKNYEYTITLIIFWKNTFNDIFWQCPVKQNIYPYFFCFIKAEALRIQFYKISILKVLFLFYFYEFFNILFGIFFLF